MVCTYMILDYLHELHTRTNQSENIMCVCMVMHHMYMEKLNHWARQIDNELFMSSLTISIIVQDPLCIHYIMHSHQTILQNTTQTHMHDISWFYISYSLSQIVFQNGLCVVLACDLQPPALGQGEHTDSGCKYQLHNSPRIHLTYYTSSC